MGGPPGQHASLTFDNSCGYLWTKKTGTTYYFFETTEHAATCPSSFAQYGSYSGTLYEIIGRNRNVVLSFQYSWDGGNASPSGKINAISVVAESGMAATMTFADVNGHRLLQQLIFPDQKTTPNYTTVNYGYDAAGNLISVSHPPNNANGDRPLQTFGYQAVGSSPVLYWAYSPRLNASSPLGSDGGFTAFLFAGSNPATATLTEIARRAVVNPSIPDGTSQPILQPNYPANPYYYDYYTIGASPATFRDTNGHATNWILDALGRVTQTQACTATTNGTCTGTWLVSNETWDRDNNLALSVDPRGNETDYLYDFMGNTTAVGAPLVATSQGTFKPTTLYDYDAFNNVVAHCDANETHAMNGDWTPATTSIWANDSLCAAHTGVVPHWQATYTYPSYEPYGELATMTTPLGYTRHFVYASSQQAGNDFGLPTAVSGDAFTQIDGSSKTPSQTFWYDANGYVRCYSKGNGTSVLSYDSLGRLLSVADPDDSSANASSVCGKSTGMPGWNTQTTYSYYPDGSKQTSQTPAERAFGVSTSYTYDLDGNERTETAHHGCVLNQSCLSGTTEKWYDGADRLVEVAQPFHASGTDVGPWKTRYIYDLSQGAGVSMYASSAFVAYGNLYKTQMYGGTWGDVRGSAFDALDREVKKYAYSITDSNHVLQTTTQTYDATPATLGEMSSRTNPSGQQAAYSYDALGRLAAVQYTGDNGLTPNVTQTYDPDGHTVTISSSLVGAEQRTYDGDGRLKAVIEPSGGGVSDPARISYTYYGDASKAAVNVGSQTFSQAGAITYSYRSDGLLKTQSTNAFQAGTWSKAYTDAGRLQSVSGVDTQARTYDATGQLATYALGGTTLTYTHDPEGSVETMRVPNVMNVGSSQPETETLTNTLNIRGELQEQVYTPNTYSQFAHTVSTFNSGYRDTNNVSPLNGSPPEKIIDYVSGILVATIGAVSQSDPYNGVGYSLGSSSQFTFDASGRETRKSSISDTFYEYENGSGNTMARAPHVDAETTQTYDAENHTVSFHSTTATTDRITGGTNTTDYGVTTIGWGPNGHPITLGNYVPPTQTPPVTETLHWDGDTVLFCTDSTGKVLSFNVGRDAVTGPQGMTVIDRDTAGVALMYSNSTGHGALTPLDPSDLTGPSLPATPGFVGGTVSDVPYTRDDGINIGPVRVSGPRAYDPTLGSWTTADAYEGDIHDPASQQRYMWNRNNPVEYSDPSGYDSLIIIDPKAVGGIGGHMSIVVYDPTTRAGTMYSAGPPNGEFSAKLNIAITPIADVAKLGKMLPGRDFFHQSATAAQDKAVMTFLDAEKARGDKGQTKFNGVTHNCAMICADALGAGHEGMAGWIGLWPQVDRLYLHGAKIDPASLATPVAK